LQRSIFTISENGRDEFNRRITGRHYMAAMETIPNTAREAHEAAGLCIRERRFIDAIPFAEETTRSAPEWPAPWWNLTVGYKHARRWKDALRACERVIECDPGDAEGPHWNAGIAATALGAGAGGVDRVRHQRPAR
jgi:hypothetical protein